MIYKFGEICLKDGFVRGPFGSALKKDLFVEKGADTYKVYEQCVPLEQDKNKGRYYISGEYFRKSLKRFEVQNNDFLVSCSGVNYGAIYHLQEPFEKGVINQALLIIRINPELVDYDYFYYLFSFVLRKAIVSGTGDSTIPNFPPTSVIKNIEVNIPELKEQKRIGRILKSIDAQVKRNNEMVQKLQVLSHTIFNRFFASESSLVPLVEFPYIQILKPGIQKFEGIKHYIATAEVEGEKINYDAPLIEYATRENRANMQPIPNSIWFAKMKRSIKHIYVTSNDNHLIDNYVFSTGFCGIKCDDVAFEYMVNYLNLPYFEKEKDILSHGATMEGVNNEDLKSFKIHLPAKETLLLFSNTTRNIHYEIAKINKMTHQLTLLKNRLLPLLISGQLQ